MAENTKIFQTLKTGGTRVEWRIDGKLVGKGAVTGLKTGGHDRGTYPYPFPMWVHPQILSSDVAFLSNKSSAFTSRVSLHKLFQLSAKIKYLLQSYTLSW